MAHEIADRHLPDYSCLPRDIFWHICHELELFDLARAMLVCKNWKQLFQHHIKLNKQKYEYPAEEHERFLYRTTRQDHQEITSRSDNLWSATAMKMANWLVNLASNIQVLVIDWPIRQPELFSLTDKCPNLKHLIAKKLSRGTEHINRLKCQALKARLKTAIVHFILDAYRPGMCRLKLPTDKNLQIHSVTFQFAISSYESFYLTPVFPTEINESADSSIVPIINPRNSLTYCSNDFFALKYLRLGGMLSDDSTLSDNIPFILSRCPDLLVLVLEDLVMVDDASLISMQQTCMNLKALWLVNNHLCKRFSHGALKGLYDSLLKADRRRTFQDFYIVALGAEIALLKEAAPAFNFVEEHYESEVPSRFSILDPYMQNLLNLVF